MKTSFNFWPLRLFVYFCLRPSAKDQGIVVVVVVVLALHYLVHFVFKRNLSEKNLPEWESNWGPPDPQPSTYPLSYRAMDIIAMKNDLYIWPHTLDQYWSTLV